MGRQHVRNGELVVRQGKTGAQLTLPIRPELQAILDATPSGDMTFLVTKSCGQYSSNDLGERFRAWCEEAGLCVRLAKSRDKTLKYLELKLNPLSRGGH